VCEPCVVNPVPQSPDGDNRRQSGTLLGSEIPHGLGAGRFSADAEFFTLTEAVISPVGGSGKANGRVTNERTGKVTK